MKQYQYYEIFKIQGCKHSSADDAEVTQVHADKTSKLGQ